MRAKRSRIKLDEESYRKLWQHVLERDRWSCQYCGNRRHLQVHHITSRGRLGDDSDGNLISLCATCHGKLHNRGFSDLRSD